MSWDRVVAGLEALGTGAASPRPAPSLVQALEKAGRVLAPTQSKRAFDEAAVEDAGVLGDEAAIAGQVSDPAPPPPLDLLKKWVSYTKKLDSRGDFVGTGHKRIAIPKTSLSEDEIKRLGFQSVLAGIPETGQDRFRSFRRVDSNHHLHSHPDYWTLHEDEHPSMTIALQKAEGPLQAAKAVTSGTSHVIGEGVPGAYYYLKGQLLGGDGMVDRLGRLARIRKKRVKTAATAVVVKGNPKFIAGNEKADKFYSALQAALQGAGYDVSFDPGEPFTEPPPADLWVGHSRGADRLRFAPAATRAVAIGSRLPGAVNHPDDDVLTPFHETGGAPPDAHYELTPEMIAALGLSKTAALPAIKIDRPKGFQKVFPTPAGPVTKSYPVDYGYFDGIINPDDNEGADVFVGDGSLHGRFMKGKNLSGKWEPDERKWFMNLTPEQLAAVKEMFTSQSPDLLQDEVQFADEAELARDLAGLRAKTAEARLLDLLCPTG